ncbi:hypothetical protein Ndes2437B_g08442 [Nannochloris sp. 'desiccata']
MTPEMPLLAVEWGRSGSQCSPGISLSLHDVSMPPPAAPPPAAALTVATGRQSQLATLHCPGRTASIAGASIGQALLNRRCSSEGTVQVVVTAPGMPTSPRIPATATGGGNAAGGADNNNNNTAVALNASAPAAASQDNNTAQPANSAANNNAFRGRATGPSGNRNDVGRGRGGIEPDDSTTAISHAPGAAAAATAAAATAATTPSVAVATVRNNPRPNNAAAAAAAAAKPTDSYSSAAANALPPPGDRGHDRNGGNGAAASLASHHHHNDDDHGAGGGSLDIATAAVDDDIRQAIDMPAPPLPSTNYQAQNHQLQATTAAAAAAPVTAMLTPASRMGNGVLLTPGHGLTPLQIQSVVSAAFGRAGSLSPRPGESSSSGNRPLVFVGLKRKKPPSGVGRPPMAPPAQVPRTNVNNNNNNINLNNQGPTASSPGFFAPQQADNTLAVEDAVSMVEHGLGTADVEVACDAVSKASQGEVEDGNGGGGFVDDGEGGGFIGSGCPSLAGPGVSLASAG